MHAIGTPTAINRVSENEDPNAVERRYNRRAHYQHYECHYCPQKFTTKYNLKFHEMKHELKRDVPKDMIESSGLKEIVATKSVKKPQFKCKICQKMFLVQRNYDKHMLSHASDKPFECELCDTKFAKKCQLDQHRYKHWQDDVWDCNLCEMTCYSKDDLHKHKRIHAWIVSVESYFPFDTEDSALIFQSITIELDDIDSIGDDDDDDDVHENVKSNRKLHSDKQHSYRCKECKKQFTSQMSLKRHTKKHPIQRRHVCFHCKQSFERSDQKMKHELEHLTKFRTQEVKQQFSCSYCDQTFDRSYLRKRHELDHERNGQTLQ